MAHQVVLDDWSFGPKQNPAAGTTFWGSKTSPILVFAGVVVALNLGWILFPSRLEPGFCKKNNNTLFDLIIRMEWSGVVICVDLHVTMCHFLYLWFYTVELQL